MQVFSLATNKDKSRFMRTGCFSKSLSPITVETAINRASDDRHQLQCGLCRTDTGKHLTGRTSQDRLLRLVYDLA